MTDHAITKALVKRTLEEACDGIPVEGDWTLQGLGMLRLYLTPDKTHRLHVWDDRYIFDPKPSELHTHPWGLRSLVVAGEVRNTRYVGPITEWPVTMEAPHLWNRQRILCGTGGGLCEDFIESVYLSKQEEERYSEGASYTQRADEIHRSNPLRGTVTIVTRTFEDDPDHADVLWPVGEDWISAEPRTATVAEIEAICSTALLTWF